MGYVIHFESAWLFAEIFTDVSCLFLHFISIYAHIWYRCFPLTIFYGIKSLHPRVFVCFAFLLFFFSRENQRKESSWKSEKEWKGNVSWHQPAVSTIGPTVRFFTPSGFGWVLTRWASLIHERKAGWRRISLPSTNMTMFQEEIPQLPWFFWRQEVKIWMFHQVLAWKSLETPMFLFNRWYSQLTWWLSNFNRKAVLQREARTSTLPPIEAKFDVSRISIALLEFNCFPTGSIDVPSNWNQKKHKPKTMVWLWTSM